jgi:hypothetical protein
MDFKSTGNNFYQNEYVKVFYDIEKQGIALDLPVFTENFNVKQPKI